MAKRARSPSPVSRTERYTSSAINDRSSTFVACFSSRISAWDLQRDPGFSTATHRITAWRTPSTQRSLNAEPILDTGHDDDGERNGGKVLERLLVASNVTGAIVVARWYGGVMLGPVRFDHIRNCATEAIAKCKAGISKPVKQIKLGEDDRRREALVAILKERDQSVSVLRNLLAQKKGRAAKGQDNKDPPATANNYRTLPLQVLEKLEQVRDATIGWILKEIEKAEDTKSENSAGQVAQSPEREIKE